MKFLVIWKLELSLLSPQVAAAVARMPVYNFAHFTVYPLADMPEWDEAAASDS